MSACAPRPAEGESHTMFSYIMKQKRLLFLEAVAATLRAGCGVLLSFAMGEMTNSAVDGQLPVLLSSGAVCVVCLAALYGLQVLETYLRKTLSARCICAVKADLYSALVRRGPAALHGQSDSYYLNMLQGDIELLERDYFDSIWRAINLSIQVVCCAAALIAVSARLFVIFALVSIAPQLASRWFKRPLQRRKDEFSRQNARCVQRGREFIGGFDTILFFSRSELFISRLLDEDRRLEASRRRRDTYSSAASGGANAINMVAQILCMGAAAYFIAVGELRIGALTSSTQLLNFIFTPLNTVINCALAIVSTRGLRDKFTGLTSARPVRGDMEFRRGDIVFEGVTAGYAGREVLRDFSCRLRQGGRYAIVGASGAGKSTLVRALMGTARVSAGRITLGGVDVGRIPLSELYRHVLYVPQTTFVFEGTVRDNIGLFSGEPGVEEAARRAALPDSLLDAPAGGDSGVSLSGGERTRIAVARALCSKSEVLIFDEPTSGLDPDTAGDVERAILSITGRTVVVITHNWDEAYLSSFDGVIDLGGER